MQDKFPPQAVQVAQERARDERRFDRGGVPERPVVRDDLRRDFLREDRERRDEGRSRERVERADRYCVRYLLIDN